MGKYVCPHCGAYDSTTCKFKISALGQVVKSQQEEARKVGCRVQHYTELLARTGSYND